jgi:hypothetical protein
METTVKNNGQAKVTKNVKEDKTPKFVAGNPVNKVSKNAEEKKENKAQTENSGFVNVNEEAKKQHTENGMPAQATPATEAPQTTVSQEDTPQAEPTKKEIKAALVAQIAEQRAKLERHIQLGDLLARKIKQRDNLSNVITTLKAFEINLKENEEVTDSNFYQGCQLTIKDDKGETFVTKNSTIIQGVAGQVLDLCTDKMEEVETEILNMIPAEI